MSEYKPSLKEIAKESGNIIKNTFKYWAKLKWAGIKGLGKGIYYGAKVVHTIPTFVRHAKSKGEWDDLPLNKTIEIAFGCFSGISTMYASIAGYAYLSLAKDHPEALLILPATNALSGLYEIARHRLIKKKSLEDKVE